MLDQARVAEIQHLAGRINSTSEKYQLIHAMFAIEKIFRDNSNSHYRDAVSRVWNDLKNPNLSADQKASLMQQARDLREEANKRIRILVDYIPQIKEDSARITQTQHNTFMIVLPKSMECTRGTDNKINFEVLGALRRLMAHELGHIVLHSGLFDSYDEGSKGHREIEITDVSEEEAEIFAKVLIDLRRDRNREIYDKDRYLTI